MRGRTPGRAAREVLTATAAGVLLAACTQAHGEPTQRVPDGDPDRGVVAMQRFGCGSCHVIPGVHGADGMVGPPLTSFGRRVYIAGEVSNTPEHLLTWIEVPQAIEPGTAMPNLGVTEQEARDIAAYLYTLR